jgi:hypothetical protein
MQLPPKLQQQIATGASDTLSLPAHWQQCSRAVADHGSLIHVAALLIRLLGPEHTVFLFSGLALWQRLGNAGSTWQCRVAIAVQGQPLHY